ncbi:MAG: thioredoxin family protein [Saprospiraceae bacterium]|nr:thioredoxin family protein [Saprospiraceae bacterium]MDP4700480.1 thioredoxin family protein [Saprospiraceae bacterium]MDP4815022.1 thioredoxin family protein [Saprospiraceae bacterium]MDP5090356.1 thioredoxin family protein [Saprospiraceae bacterium]
MPVIHKVKLLGIGASKDKALRELVDQAMSVLNIHWPIEEIKDINLLIHYGITGIPALIIDDNVIFQVNVPSYSELLQVFKEFTTKENDQKLYISKIPK